MIWNNPNVVLRRILEEEIIERNISRGIRLLFDKGKEKVRKVKKISVQQKYIEIDGRLIKLEIIQEKTEKHRKSVKCKRCNCIMRYYDTNRRHHIIPRKYCGSDEDFNRIPLCSKCHDYVEIKTYEWVESGKNYDIDLLKSMIINDGFE